MSLNMLQKELLRLSSKLQMSEQERWLFNWKVEMGKLVREDDPASHFDVMAAIYDPERRLVLLGDHKKSGLYLFNGGHIDKGELPREALRREVSEEVGWEMERAEVPEPELLTICPIEIAGMTCRRHYDLWFFLPVNSEKLVIDEEKMATEYWTWGWYSLEEARKLETSEPHETAFDFIENKKLTVEK